MLLDVDRAAAARRLRDDSSSGCSSRRRTGSSRTAASARAPGSAAATSSRPCSGGGASVAPRVVLTGSQATADAVRDVAAARPLYPGLDERFSPGSTRDGSVLHIGSNDPRDDTPTALAAARAAGERLVVVGGYAGPADGAQVVGRVTDDELVEHYRRADAFVDTSLYEGFGFQVLEAMACGTPVVASDTTSIPELVGDAALLCPPGDVDAFAAALRRLRSEDGLADELRRRGLARAGRVHVGAHGAAARGRRRGGGARVIVFVHGLRNWGAVEEYVAALVRGLRERGEDVALLYPDDPVLAPFAELGAAGGTFDLDAPGLTLRLRRELRRLRPAIVHATDVFPQAQLAARLAGVRRLFVTHHTPELPRRDNLAGRAWQRARLADAAGGDLHVRDGPRVRRPTAPHARRPARDRPRSLRERDAACSRAESSATSRGSPSRRAIAT